MYCVKCGVRLQDNVTACPLCNTPVWNPDGNKESFVSNYPDNLPRRTPKDRKPALILVTALSAFAVLVETVICLILYQSLRWSGYVTGGVLLAYFITLFPLWFRKPKPELLIPADFAAAALLTYYICRKTGGGWFFSFALPALIAACLITAGFFCLFKYVRRGKLFILSGLSFALGLFMILIEYLQHLTFGTEMFLWSLFPFASLAAIGILLIFAGLIPPLRNALKKYFFF